MRPSLWRLVRLRGTPATSAVLRYRPLEPRSRPYRNDRNAAVIVSSGCGHHRPDPLQCCPKSRDGEGQQWAGRVSSKLSDAVIRSPASAAARWRSHAPFDLAVTSMKRTANVKFQSRPADRPESAGRQLQTTAAIRLPNSNVSNQSVVVLRSSVRVEFAASPGTWDGQTNGRSIVALGRSDSARLASEMASMSIWRPAAIVLIEPAEPADTILSPVPRPRCGAAGVRRAPRSHLGQ